MWSKVNSWLTEIDRRPNEERKREDAEDEEGKGGQFWQNYYLTYFLNNTKS